VLVVAQSFEETGIPRPGVTVHSPPDDAVSQILTDANDLLSEFNDYLLEPLWILPLATLLAGVLLALTSGSCHDPADLRRPLDSPGRGTAAQRFERDLAPYLASGRGANFVYPAAVLRDSLDVDLGRAIGVAAPLVALDEPALRQLVVDRAGPAGLVPLTELLQLVRRLPGREQVSPWTLTPGTASGPRAASRRRRRAPRALERRT